MTPNDLKSKPEIIQVFHNRLSLLKENGELVCLCPFHDEKTASFKVFQHQGVWLFKCFGCQKTGNGIQFVADFDHIPFGAAMKKVEQELTKNLEWHNNKNLVESTFQPVQKTDKKKLVIPLSKYYPLEQGLTNSKEAQAWLLKERGIIYDVAKQLHIGYRRVLGDIAGDKNRDISDHGWLAFPYLDGSGNVAGIKYRSMARKVFCHQPGMSAGIFGMETIDPLEVLFVTEGEFDALCLQQAGFRAISLPSASYKLSPDQKDRIMEASQIILAGDTDATGQESMQRLWNDFQERTHLLTWPGGWKDANEVFLQMAGGNVEAFRKIVNEEVQKAKAIPAPNIYSLPESMVSANRTNLSDHPNRLHAPWPSVDKMAIILPGSVVTISATNTKMGKSCFVMDWTVEAARQGEIVLNYQCELSIDEFSNMVAAHVLKKSRNSLSKDDYKEASRQLEGIQYYIGRNPTLVTVNPVLDLIEAAIRRFGATVVVLDHLHFICRNEQNPVQAQENAMQRIKNMAVKYGVKFIVVGQPRKANQASKGKVIHVTDIKGSETFGSDADAIFIIHRDNIIVKDPTNPPKDDYSPQTEVHLLGARSKGDGGTFCILTFIGEWATFWEQTGQQNNFQNPETEQAELVL